MNLYGIVRGLEAIISFKSISISRWSIQTKTEYTQVMIRLFKEKKLK